MRSPLSVVYNSELVAPYDVLDHVRFRTKDAPRVFTVPPKAGPVRTFEGLTSPGCATRRCSPG